MRSELGTFSRKVRVQCTNNFIAIMVLAQCTDACMQYWRISFLSLAEDQISKTYYDCRFCTELQVLLLNEPVLKYVNEQQTLMTLYRLKQRMSLSQIDHNPQMIFTYMRKLIISTNLIFWYKTCMNPSNAVDKSCCVVTVKSLRASPFGITSL